MAGASLSPVGRGCGEMAMRESANLPILFKGVAEVVDYMGVAQALQHPGLVPKVRLLRAIVCCQYLDCHQQPLPPRLVHLQSRGDSGARALCSEGQSSSSVSYYMLMFWQQHF